MSTETMFATQIASLLAFLGTLFVLYRLLVRQKDATIEAQRERIGLLQDRIANEATDVLHDHQAKRIKLLQEEITRLGLDQQKNAELIKEKVVELEAIKAKLKPMQVFALNASGLSLSYFCPQCEEPTLQESEVRTTYFPLQHQYFRVVYSCGCVLVDGNQEFPCSQVR